jgi:hypothetical protein
VTPRERKLTPELLDHHKREALRLRREAQREAILRLIRYAVAPASAASKSGYRFCVRLRSLF